MTKSTHQEFKPPEILKKHQEENFEQIVNNNTQIHIQIVKNVSIQKYAKLILRLFVWTSFAIQNPISEQKHMEGDSTYSQFIEHFQPIRWSSNQWVVVASIDKDYQI